MLRSMRRAPVVIAIAVIGMLLPIPFSGAGFIQDDPGSGCTLRDWNGFAPLPFAAAEAISDRPPSFTYYEERTRTCV
jgi:hypothetical protein